jgi:medium-chain acyl-CoA synthetase
MLRDVDTNVPPNFNFATDIIDKHAGDPTIKNKLAFYYVSEKDENVTKWSFKDLSDKSKFYANSLRSFGSIDRAILILPKIPEWWILNIAALRNNTALMPVRQVHHFVFLNLLRL